MNSILGEGALYGSSEDNTTILEFLAVVSVTEDQSTESLVSLIINKLGRLSEVDIVVSVRVQFSCP